MRTVIALGVTLLLAQDVAPPLPPPPPNPPAPSVSAPDDPGWTALIATCRTPPPPRGGGAGRGGARGGPPPGPRDYTVAAIPGVIDTGKRWKFLWQEAGNNGDGIVGTNDGGLLIAQNDNSRVVKLDKNGKPSVVYTGTRTGGSLSMSSNGAVFIVQRALRTAVAELAPRKRVLADTYNGDPLDCAGLNPNDLSADSKGGVYFTQGGVFYANPKGSVSKYGQSITPNGIILSADEKVLYVTNGPTLAAFDVQPDGSLTNQHHRCGRPHLRHDQPRRAGDRPGRQISRDHSNPAAGHQRGIRRPRQGDAVRAGARRARRGGQRDCQCCAGVFDPDGRAGLSRATQIALPSLPNSGRR